MEEPIPDSKLSLLQQEWQSWYGTVLEAHLEPADSLRGRVWREFSKRAITVIEIRKVKSLLMQSAPMAQEVVQWQDSSKGAVSLFFAPDADVLIWDVVSYYWGLRVFMNACAFCRNFSAREFRWSRQEIARIMLDGCLQDAMTCGHGCLTWLTHNDILLRGKAASKIRRGMHAGRALQAALTEHLEWRAPPPAGRSAHWRSLRRQNERRSRPIPPPAAKHARLPIHGDGWIARRRAFWLSTACKAVSPEQCRPAPAWEWSGDQVLRALQVRPEASPSARVQAIFPA